MKTRSEIMGPRYVMLEYEKCAWTLLVFDGVRYNAVKRPCAWVRFWQFAFFGWKWERLP